jgi:exodeoxyribonuclease V alpha subunit
MNLELSEGEAKAAKIGIDYSNFSLEEEKMERKTQASHQVILAYEDGTEETLAATGDFNEAVFSLGYCLTVHKAQGSEWRKVFFVLHKEHSTMHFREHFYTAITRARTKVTLIGKDFVIDKIIAAPRIKGNSLKDKLEYFNSGIDQNFDIRCTKI